MNKCVVNYDIGGNGMRKFMIKVNGNSYEVEVEEVKQTGLSNKQQSVQQASAPVLKTAPVQSPEPPVVKNTIEAVEGQEVIEAPMPGSILRIDVKEGQEIKAGDIILILEAMKMENEILAPRDGRISAIATSAGASVNTGDKLVVID